MEEIDDSFLDQKGGSSPRDGKWKQYPPHVAERVEHMYQLGGTQPFTIRLGQKEYMVDFSLMVQEDCLTGQRMRIRRSDPHISNAFAFLEDIQFYSTGCQLIALVPPHVPPNMGDKTMQRIFSLDTGAWLSDEPLHIDWVSSTFYDSSTNSIWAYRSTTCTLTRSVNNGPIHDEFRGIPGSKVVPKDTKIASDSKLKALGMFSAVLPSRIPSLTVLLRVFKRLSLYARVACGGNSIKKKTHHPFCIELHPETFEHFNTIIISCHAYLKRFLERKSSSLASDDTMASVLATLGYVLELVETNLSCLWGFHDNKAIVELLPKLCSTLQDLQVLIKAQGSTKSYGFQYVQRRVSKCLMAGCRYFYPTPASLRSLIVGTLSSEIKDQSNKNGDQRQEEFLDMLLENSQLLVLLDSMNDFMHTMNALIAHVSKQTLNNLKMFSDTKEEKDISKSSVESSAPVNARLIPLSSHLRLLAKLQLYFLTIASSRSQTNEIDTHFQQYVCTICEACKQIFSCASTLLEQARDEFNMKKISYNVFEKKVENADVLLRSSIPGILFQSLTSFLGMYSGIFDIQSAYGSLIELMSAIDRFNLIVSSARKEKEFEYAFESSKPELQTKVIESPHPYVKGTIDQNLQIPGALYMTVEFDERCCSRNSNDALKISRSFPRWQFVAYGAPTQRHHSNWPVGKNKRLLRVRGDTLTFYWNVEKDDKKHKENNWGFHCTVYGYVPNCRGLDTCSRNPIATLLPWSVDLELSLSFSLGRLVRSILASSPIEDMRPGVGRKERLRMMALTQGEDADLDRIVDLRAISDLRAKSSVPAVDNFVKDFDTSKPLNAKLQRLRSVMHQLVGRGPQMNPLMKDALQPAENTMLMCALCHSGLDSIAAELVEKLSMDQKGASLQKYNDLCLKLKPVWELVHGILTWMIRQAQLMKRWYLMVDIVAAVPEEKQDSLGSERNERKKSKLRKGNSSSATKAKRSPRIKEAESELKQLSDDTVAQLYELHNMNPTDNQSPGGSEKQLKDLTDLLIDHARTLSKSKVDQAYSHAESKEYDEKRIMKDESRFDEKSRDEKKVKEKKEERKRREEKVKQNPEKITPWTGKLIRLVSTPTSSGATTSSILGDISARVSDMARFLTKRDSVLSHSVETSLSIVEQFLRGAGKGLINVDRLEKAIAKREKRSIERAIVYKIVAGSLKAISFLPVMKFMLLRPVPCVYYCHGLSGAPSDKMKILQDSFGKLLAQVSMILDTTSVTSTSKILLHRLALQYCMLPFSSRDTTLIVTAPFHISLLSLAKRAYTSSTYKMANNEGRDYTNQCMSAVTGSNFVQMEVYECQDCGLNNGECCCRVCAMTCHKGHRVTFKRRSKAFCDCGFTSSCKCMLAQQMLRCREEQVVLGRMALLVFRTLASRFNRWQKKAKEMSGLSAIELLAVASSNDSKIVKHANPQACAAVRLQSSALELLFELTTKNLKTFQESSPADQEEQESMMRDLIRVGYLLLREIEMYEIGGTKHSETISSREAEDPTAASMPKSRPMITVPVKPKANIRYLSTLISMIREGSQNIQRLTIRSMQILLRSISPKTMLSVVSKERKLKQQGTESLPTPKEMIKDLLSIIGEFAFKNDPRGVKISADMKHRCTDDGSKSLGTDSATMPPVDNFRLVLWRPDGVPVNAYVQQFMELFSTQLAQLSQRSWRDSNVQTLKNSVAATKQRLQFGLRQSSWATLLTGSRKKCYDFGLKVASKGMQCVVEPCTPDVCAVRNRILASHLQDRNFSINGLQVLERSSHLSEALQTMLLAEPTDEWASITRDIIIKEFGQIPKNFRDPNLYDGKTTNKNRNLVPAQAQAVGAMCIVSGFLCNMVRVGGYVKVNTVGDTRTKDRQSPMVLPRPRHTGVVVSMEQGYNQMRVVFSEDSLGRPTLVHRSKLTGIRRFSDTHIAQALASFDVSKSISLASLHILRTLKPSERKQKFGSCQASLLRSLALGTLSTMLAAPPKIDSKNAMEKPLQRMLLERIRFLRIIRDEVASQSMTAYVPTCSGAQRHLDSIVRGLARMYEVVNVPYGVRGLAPTSALKTAMRSSKDSGGVEAKSQRELPYLPSWCWTNAEGPMPSRWNREAAPHCLFIHGSCRVVNYAGGHSRRFKMSKGDDLPVTVVSDEPVPDGVTLHYFEIKVLPAMANYDPTSDQLFEMKKRKHSRTNSTESEDLKMEYNLSQASSHGPFSRSRRDRISIGLCSNGNPSTHKSVHGWSDGSLVFQCHNGYKARYLAKARVPSVEEGFKVDDLLDVKDSVGKWEPAVVISTSSDQVKVHYINWDARYDEFIDRASDRLAPFRSHTAGTVGQLFATKYSAPANVGSTIGCLWNRAEGTVSFTIDGKSSGVAFTDVRGKFFPAVTLYGPGVQVAVNFGQVPFRFNLETQPELERSKLEKFSETKDLKIIPCEHIVPPTPFASPKESLSVESKWRARFELARDIIQSGILPDSSIVQVARALEQHGDSRRQMIDWAFANPVAYEELGKLPLSPRLNESKAFLRASAIHIKEIPVLNIGSDTKGSSNGSSADEKTVAPQEKGGRKSSEEDYSDNIDVEEWFESEDEEGFVETSVKEAVESEQVNFHRLHDSEEGTRIEPNELTLPLLQRQNLQPGYTIGGSGSFDGSGPAVDAEVEEAEAARTLAHISNMDLWLSQLEQGLGSQQLERVQQMLQQLRRLNFGSLAGAIRALPHLRPASQSAAQNVVLFSRPSGDSRSNPRDITLSDEISFWSPTAIAGRQTIVQEQLSTVEQSVTGSGPMVGLRVRISATAKKDSLSAESSRSGIFDPSKSPWLPEMDATEGCIGVIRALDADDSNLQELGPNLALVEVWDNERSMVSLWWYSVKHLLSRPASCQNSFLGLETTEDISTSIEKSMKILSARFASNILHKLSPYILHDYMRAEQGVPERLWRNVVTRQQALAALNVSLPRSPLPDPVTARLLKDVVKLQSKRLLRLDYIFNTPAIVPQIPAMTNNVVLPSVMDDYLPILQALLTKNPYWGCQLLRRARDLLKSSSETLHVSAKVSQSSAMNRSCVVWSKCVQVNDASLLLVAFDKSCKLPPGVLLAFYSNKECTDLIRCFSRQVANANSNNSNGLSSFSIPTNTVWIRCSVSAQAQSRKSNDSAEVQLRFTISPIHCQLRLGCWIAHHLMNTYEIYTTRLESIETQRCGDRKQRVKILKEQQEAAASILYGTYTVALTLLDMPQAPAIVQVMMCRLLTRLVSIRRPRGHFDDLKGLQRPCESLSCIYSKELEGVKRVRERGRIPSAEKNVAVCLHSQLSQGLVQLMLAASIHSSRVEPSLSESSLSFPPNDDTLIQFLKFKDLNNQISSDTEEKITQESESESDKDVEILESVQVNEGMESSHRPTANLSEGKLEHKRIWAPTSSYLGEWFEHLVYVAKNFRSLLTRKNETRSNPVSLTWTFPNSTRSHGKDSKSLNETKGDIKESMNLSFRAYEELSLYLSALADRQSVSPLVVSARFPVPVSLRLDRLLKLEKHVLESEARNLQRLNTLLYNCLSVIDLSASSLESPWCLGSQLRRCRRLIFKRTKLTFVDRVLAATSMPYPQCPTVRINRIMASDTLGIDASKKTIPFSRSSKSGFGANGKQSARERLRQRLYDIHTSISSTIFGQTYKQLKDVSPNRLRPAQPRGTAPHVALNIVFEGEQVLGQAGPYRAFFSDISRELQQLQSPEDPFPVSLLMPTPNNLHRIGEDRDRYMPHPSMTSVQHLELYEFMGRLMGIAMRTNIIMSLDLASLVWKQLVGSPLTLDDLQRVDQALVKNVLNPLNPRSPQALDRKEFMQQFGSNMTISLTKSDASPMRIFSPRSSDSKVESNLGNVNRGWNRGSMTTDSLLHVGYDDRAQLVSILIKSRLEETKLQVNAIRRGFCSIIPEQLLGILSWEELEERVCGSRDIDIKLLKRHTEYGPDVDKNAPHIQYLWKTLEGFTQEQRRRFVKFAFAQERLPSTDEGFSHPKIRMLIKSSRYGGKKGKNQDNAMPHADTCFFNVEIPAYSSEEIMRKRLTTVVNMDWGMSGDDIGVEHSLQSVLTTSSSAPFSRMSSSQSRGSSRSARSSVAQSGPRGSNSSNNGTATNSSGGNSSLPALAAVLNSMSGNSVSVVESSIVEG